MSDPPLPDPSRLDRSRPDFDLIIAAHAAAIVARERTYLDPSTGLTVQTRDAHLERGSCCENGCRHCPWVGTL
ncbi:MAG TPA: DUF5522 domain-containing protein [Acidimicrobiales bacterium]